MNSDDVTFYLMNVSAGATRELSYHLTPSLAIDATAQASTVYAYYDPAIRQTRDAVRFVATSAAEM
ncbi:MAG: hypothetical protein IPK60_25570 [Sandaracinaceae bacterium]|nr:hypothetical protein [Sandaracinaceae bacterium]